MVLIELDSKKRCLKMEPMSQRGRFTPRALADKTASDAEAACRWGLGLTLVRSAAEAHGGQVTIDSSVEAGTTFTIQLAKAS